MECIEQLKSIGAREIHIKTKIANNRLDEIFECRYEALDKTRALGFIHILEREYKIDMSEWLNAYNEHHRKQEELLQTQKEENKNQVKEKVSIPIIDSTTKDKTYIRLIALLVIVVILFALFFIYNNIISSSDSTLNADSSHIINNEAVPQIEAPLVDENNSQNDNAINDNATIETSSNESTQESSQMNSESNAIESSKNEIIIIPKEPLWIGMIDLQTYSKKQMSISSAEIITLDNDQLIRTGHSLFEIIAPNFSKKYIGGDSKYFLYTTNNGLKEITKDEFLSFNRGEEW